MYVAARRYVDKISEATNVDVSASSLLLPWLNADGHKTRIYTQKTNTSIKTSYPCPRCRTADGMRGAVI